MAKLGRTNEPLAKAWLGKRMEALERVRMRLQAEINREAGLLEIMGTSHPREKGDLSEEGREDEETVETLKALQSSFDEIEEAQERIRGGTYGSCTDCLRAIPRRRLEVLPSAIRCGDCQRKHEASEIFQYRSSFPAALRGPKPRKPNRRSRAARYT